jgi:sugar fermentation stimulation protein A
MKFENDLIEGTFIKRYKRFFTDIMLEDDEVITAHVANTGSMKSCIGEGWKAAVSFHDNPKRKLKYSLQMLHNGQSWIGINTSMPNKLAVEAIENGTIKELSHYQHIRPEKKVGDSRIDLYLYNDDGTDAYVEIKNVTLKEIENQASFPDSVTTRGQKHLMELKKLVGPSTESYMLYIIQREDVSSFQIASEIDPEYSRLLNEAIDSGVKVLSYGCTLNKSEVIISHPIPFLG